MPISIPVSTPYKGNFSYVPAAWAEPAVEGAKFVPFEINWGDAAQAGPNKCVSINFQNNAPLNFSKIVALGIDCSQCGADVTFVFPDTAQTFTIPAYTPVCIIPVFTQQTQFFVVCPNGITNDVVRGSIHNTMPPPVTLPTTVHQQTVSNFNIGMVNGTYVMAASVNGTVEALSINRSVVNTGADYRSLITIQDGASNTLFQLQTAGVAASSADGLIFNLSGLQTRFNNGLSLVLSGVQPTVGTGGLSYNLMYKTP